MVALGQTMIGFPRVKKIFKQTVDSDAQNIINRLVEFGESWRGDRPQNDDITFIVIKYLSDAFGQET